MNTHQKIKRRKTVNKAKAIVAAQRLLRDYARREMRDNDEWQAIDSTWDVNLWEDNGKPRATLYPVLSGQTVTSRATPITLRRSESVKRRCLKRPMLLKG